MVCRRPRVRKKSRFSASFGNKFGQVDDIFWDNSMKKEPGELLGKSVNDINYSQ